MIARSMYLNMNTAARDPLTHSACDSGQLERVEKRFFRFVNHHLNITCEPRDYCANPFFAQQRRVATVPRLVTK